MKLTMVSLPPTFSSLVQQILEQGQERERSTRAKVQLLVLPNLVSPTQVREPELDQAPELWNSMMAQVRTLFPS